MRLREFLKVYLVLMLALLVVWSIANLSTVGKEELLSGEEGLDFEKLKLVLVQFVPLFLFSVTVAFFVVNRKFIVELFNTVLETYAKVRWFKYFWASYAIAMLLLLLFVGGGMLGSGELNQTAPLNRKQPEGVKGWEDVYGLESTYSMLSYMSGGLVLGLLASMVFIGVYAFYTIRKSKGGVSLDVVGYETKIRLAESVERIYVGMCREDDKRVALIRCFEELCEELRTAGLPQKDSETAREYVERVASTLSVPPEHLKLLLSLFEKARYSVHEITDEDLEAAKRSLLCVKEALVRS